MALHDKTALFDSLPLLNGLKPPLRAYGLAYAAVTGPRILGCLKTSTRKDLSWQDKGAIFASILKTSTQLHRFPTASAIIVAGATIFPRVILSLFRLTVARTKRSCSTKARVSIGRWIRYLCTFLSAWFAFALLNRDQSWARKRARSRASLEASATENDSSTRQHSFHQPEPLTHAGKTIDFTLFAVLRAIDALVASTWNRTRSSPWHPECRVPHLASIARWAADPSIFSSSAAVIMWAWFYAPERLPKTYNRWISTAASIDSRLIRALRLCRQGVFVYGRDTGQAPLVTSLCDELGLPQVWGDPAKTVPIPCELYHCGAGKSCEVHALSRFAQSFRFAMEVYLPLHLLGKIKSWDGQAFLQAARAAAQSSSFLAAFVALFYYSVCLARTRVGPRIFSYNTITPQMWDSGLCVLAGCLTCGWSILLEKPSRRQEVAFFVAPRALATLLPRVYDRKHQRKEQLCFALSVTVVLSMARKHTGEVRGIFGRLLSRVLKE